MTPLHLAILLHYCMTDEPYAKGDTLHANSIAVTAYHGDLVIKGLLLKTEHSFQASDMGRVWIDQLCTVPLPVLSWVAQWPKQ